MVTFKLDKNLGSDHRNDSHLECPPHGHAVLTRPRLHQNLHGHFWAADLRRGGGGRQRQFWWLTRFQVLLLAPRSDHAGVVRFQATPLVPLTF